MERVVVTGMGVASPLGCNMDEFWSELTNGRSGVVALAGDDYADLPTRIGGVVNGYRESDYFDRKELRRMSRSSQLAIVAASQAIAGAGLDGSAVNPREVGVIIGSSIGGFAASDPMYRDFYLNGRYTPMTIPISMNMGPSASVSIRYRYQGPLMNIDAACASANHAIGHVYHLIRAGVLDVAIAGGADSAFFTRRRHGLVRYARYLCTQRRPGSCLPPVQRRPRWYGPGRRRRRFCDRIGKLCPAPRPADPR